jgi:peptidoglycan LD-endopeptidase CwlK
VSTRLEDLEDDVVPMAHAFIQELLSNNVQFVVTSTLRTSDEQKALYAQGREPIGLVNVLRTKAGMRPIGQSENSYTVTNCDGVKKKSPHQSGRALDVVPADSRGNPYWPKPDNPAWGPISEAGIKAGFTWGGSWTSFPDYPHYEKV